MLPSCKSQVPASMHHCPVMCSMSENGEVSILVVDGTNLVSEVSSRLLACCRSLSAVHCMSEHAMQMSVLCQVLSLMHFTGMLRVYRHAQGMGQLQRPLQPLAGKQGAFSHASCMIETVLCRRSNISLHQKHHECTLLLRELRV